MNNDVTVILNGYKRPQNLKKQVDAALTQTVKVKDIFYWQNSMPNVHYDMQTSTNYCISSYASVNFGVWARFYYALNVRTNYVCILDDDTIPGTQWIENCLNTYEKHPGLLGAIGIKFPNSSYEYQMTDRYGWDGNNNEQVERVDIVGHNWFFHRDLLSVFCRELPPIDHNFIVGEDMHFSYVLQKYTDLGTYVPPHPKSNKEMWGSLKGWELGCDEVAIGCTGGVPKMFEYTDYLRQKGFKFLHELGK